MEILSSVKPLKQEKDARLNHTVIKRPEEVKFITQVLNYETDKRIELYNITPDITAIVKSSAIQNGIMNIASLHTTTALFINEFQSALLTDIKSFLERLVGQSKNHQHDCEKNGLPSNGYKHNCEYCSDCDRKNADAHLGATLLGHNLCLQVANGELVAGKWQSIILAELDGPRERTIISQLIGS